MKNRKRKARRQQSETQTSSAADLRVRDLNAINDVRKGKSPSLPAAARKRGTTVDGIQRRHPKAVFQDRPGGRIQVRASDPYPAQVEIMTDDGPVVVTAHGSAERELAGQHRATVTGFLRGDLPASSLRKYRGKKIDGRVLASIPERITAVAEGGGWDHLENLYVIPETPK